MDDKKLKIGEVAERLGVSPNTVRNWVKQGFLSCHVTPNGHRRFSEQDVSEFIKTMQVPNKVEKNK